MTLKKKNVNIKKYLATDKKIKKQTEELVINWNRMNRIKATITSFLFCLKICKKSFKKNVEKSVDKYKKV